ncbi:MULTISPECIES: AAA family ATPase [Methylotenera]|uniref:AAA family ATPase n=1 Tax=Methylotenera TaxID=359407 RepID=UPI00039A34A9|nr:MULTISPECIES: AAA family ATPase [Methylotenera]
MKINKIQRLKGYRIFKDFSWPATLPEFGRFNLIYGWNGAGKTSLSTLFRCMQKKTTPDGDDIQFVVDGATFSGNAFESSETLSALRVFNRDFVNSNIFEKPGEEEFPPVYFLGEDSADKQKQLSELKLLEQVTVTEISELDKSSKNISSELNTYCTAQARSIRNLLLGDPRYNNYEAPRYKEQLLRLNDLDSLPAQLPSLERSKLESTIKAKLMEKIPEPVFGDLNLTGLTQRIQTALEQTVVASSISTLVENTELAGWVQHGLDLHESSEICHFCDQTIPASRIASLEAHFNDQFKILQTNIAELIGEVEELETTVKSRQLPTKAQLYEHLQPTYEKALLTSNQQSALLLTYLNNLKQTLFTKRAEPFKKLSTFSLMRGYEPAGGETPTLIKVLEAVLVGFSAWGALLGANALEEVVKIIKAHNSHTDNFDKEAKSARRELEQDEVLRTFNAWEKLQGKSNSTTEDLEKTMSELKSLRKEIIALEKDIRQHRKPAEELNVELASYLGRDELRFVVKDNGYTISRGDQPAVHLSEGERTSIAFMYFLKSLKDTGFDIKNGIVVIDDPVSSLDANSLYCAFGHMKAYTRDAAQLFVLTHNFAFFRQVKNWFNAEGRFLHKPYNPAKSTDVHFYMLNCEINEKGRNAKLETLDPLLHAHESEYHYLFSCVQEGSAKEHPKKLNEVYGMPNIARRLLESFLAFRIPGKAGELRQQVELLNGDVAKKARIVRFLHTYSHADRIAEPEHDLSLLSEAPTVLKEILELIQVNDPMHYKAMLELTIVPTE